MPEEAAPKCARCGLEFGLSTNQCGDFTGAADQTELERMDERLRCRDRELETTREKLRKAMSMLDTITRQLGDVLEVVS